MCNRHYSPGTGRFTQEDPIRDGSNWYRYCGGNPIKYTDPLGLVDPPAWDAPEAAWIAYNNYINNPPKPTPPPPPPKDSPVAPPPPDAPSEAHDAYEKYKKQKEERPQELTEEEKILIAVMFAEMGIMSPIYWEAVMHIIMNRLKNPRDQWVNAKTVTDIVTNRGQFNAYGNDDYYYCLNYLNNRDGSNQKIEDIINTILPIYYGQKEDITDGAVIYYSPAAMDPPGTKMALNMSLVQEVTIDGINPWYLTMYKYK